VEEFTQHQGSHGLKKRIANEVKLAASVHPNILLKDIKLPEIVVPESVDWK